MSECKKPFLVAVDSDGCVFDNMTVKHQCFFYPAILKVFDWKNTEDKARLWDKINLEYPLRGINRFCAIYEFFKDFPTSLSHDVYSEWIEKTTNYSNKNLSEVYEKTGDELVGKVLEWSNEVNRSIKNNFNELHVFDGVRECLEEMNVYADIVVISSANKEAVNHEWKTSGLCKYVQHVGSQDDGTKSDVIGNYIQKGYEQKHILMIGDAISDYKAAKDNGVYFYRIDYKKEVDHWKTLCDSVFQKFINGRYQYVSDDVLTIAKRDCLSVIKANIDTYVSGFQHVSENGFYPVEENKLWTMSFFPGVKYLGYFLTKDNLYLRHRKEVLESFRQRCDNGHMETHDIGFLFELTAYYDYLAMGDMESRKLVVDAADKLMARYHEKGGYIQAWGERIETGETRIIIDCMMNLPLLYIASQLTEDKKYYEAAKSHAIISMKTLLRENGSTYHTYWIDVDTGTPIRGATHQGHRDESTWARGQAWSLYGFIKSYQFTGEDLFLDASIRSADVFIQNLPDNDICYWDFDFNKENPDIYDSSAAAIAAAGLLQLSKEVESPLKERYLDSAKNILMILSNMYQNTKSIPGKGILKEGMYHRNDGARAYTSWGDYYFFEALYTFFNME